MNTAEKKGRTTPAERLRHSEVEFDQWAKAVRQQMVDALKRRGSH
jgi:hypothetical protein